MSNDTAPPRGVTAQEFFAAGIEGASMTAAHCATRIAYSTIHRASRGFDVRANTLRDLERWSIENDGARAAGIFLSAAATIAAPRPALRSDDEPADAQPEPASIERGAA